MTARVSDSRVYLALIVAAACFLAGCPTGPVSTTNPNPPSVSWTIYDQATRQSQSGLVPAGSGVTVFITPGDNYMTVFEASSPGGLKSLTLSGSGKVICSNNKAPYTESSPFTYSIAASTITLPVNSGQAVTQAPFPYVFLWGFGPSLKTGGPPSEGPAGEAYTKCGSAVPLLGTTTYSGQATTQSGVSNSSQLSVTTCASGLVSSPSITCGG
jgi:hypothetical protein